MPITTRLTSLLGIEHPIIRMAAEAEARLAGSRPYGLAAEVARR